MAQSFAASSPESASAASASAAAASAASASAAPASAPSASAASRWKTYLKDWTLTGDKAVVELIWEGVHYEIMLARNASVTDCEENKALDAAPAWTRGLPVQDNGCNEATRLYACRDFIDSQEAVWAKPSQWEYASWARFPLYLQGAPRKYQLVTTSGGQVIAVHPDARCRHVTDPVVDEYPALRKFLPDELTPVAVLGRHILKVVDSTGTPMVLKQIYHYQGLTGFRQEIAMLRDLAHHPSVVTMCGLMQPRGGFVDGILLSFQPGCTLHHVRSASKADAQRWKRQVTSALAHLHANNRVWGDAKPANIMIDDAEERSAVLFDFDGGTTEGFVSLDNAMSVQGDFEGLAAIDKFIDGLPAAATGGAAAGSGVA